MRDIIFRGKRLDNGEWVYGHIADIITGVAGFEDRAIIVPSSTALAIAVDLSTVGQYTGLKDKNGKKIFEGDILSDGAFTYEVRYKGTGFVTILDGHVYTMDTRPTKIAIGNIHDHPDLLK